MTTTVEITLPDELAQEARQAGLLSPGRLEQWLREQIRARRMDDLFTAMDAMAKVDEPAEMSPEDIAMEMAEMRAARVGRNSAAYCAGRIKRQVHSDKGMGK
jgi:hypothetical protein